MSLKKVVRDFSQGTARRQDGPGQKFAFPSGPDFGIILVKRCPPVVGLPCYELISTHVS